MTNKIVLRTVEEFLADYKPAYTPIMPLFLEGAIQYAAEAGKVNFNRLEALGDIRGRKITPKDTEMHQILAREGTKSFKKYFFGAQYVQSTLQDRQGYESVVAQVLDEHNKQSDSIMISGDGQNNGLYTSSDANYVLKSSAEIAKATDGTHVAGLYGSVANLVEEANVVAGRKLVMFYGATTVAKVNGLFLATSKPFMSTVEEGLKDVSFAKMPASVTPNSAEGYMVINLDQIKLHYTLLPEVQGQGVNEEKLYAWTNFLMGSSMVDVMAMGGIIRQPLTYAA